MTTAHDLQLALPLDNLGNDAQHIAQDCCRHHNASSVGAIINLERKRPTIAKAVDGVKTVDKLVDAMKTETDVAKRNAMIRDGKFAAGRDRQHGDYNDFWASRDLVPLAKNIKAAVLLAHGLNDYNVMPSHSVRVFEELQANKIPSAIYLHQGGHGGNPPDDMLNRWFSHYLYGVDNGVEKDAKAWVISNLATAPAPAPAARDPAQSLTRKSLPPLRSSPRLAKAEGKPMLALLL